MTWAELQSRQRDRYRRVLYREMRLTDALRELDEDWHALDRRTCPDFNRDHLARLEAR